MVVKIYILVFFILLSYNLKSQKITSIERIGNDTIIHVELPEVKITAKRIFKNKSDYNKYIKLVKKVKKVYPYAKEAKRKLDEYEYVLSKMKTDAQRKQFLRLAEKQLRYQYEEELKKLTFSEGIMLIKLIDRETGKSSYELVKELKGNFTAFLWQSIARLFGLNLKLNYDPNGDDKLIEQIIIMIEDGDI